MNRNLVFDFSIFSMIFLSFGLVVWGVSQVSFDFDEILNQFNDFARDQLTKKSVKKNQQQRQEKVSDRSLVIKEAPQGMSLVDPRTFSRSFNWDRISKPRAFFIDTYEATLVDGRAQSLATAVPATNLDFQSAKQACEVSGKRICRYSEWLVACLGPYQNIFGFQNSHETPLNLKEVCDVARTSNNTPGSLPSPAGSHPLCKTEGLEVYDMIGNASEWTIDSSGQGLTAGLAFYQSEEYTNCVYTLAERNGDRIPESRVSSDIGFRCCLDAE